MQPTATIDALTPYRNSIRRIMRAHHMDADMATLVCAGRVGVKHLEALERLRAAREQITARDLRRQGGDHE